MKKLCRPKENRIIGGFCAGLGKYWNIDPTWIRLGCLFIGIFTAFIPAIIAYFICCIITPSEERSSTPQKIHKLYLSSKNRKIAGLCGGIAEFFHIDSTVVRIIAILFLFIPPFFPVLLLYFLGWMLIPRASEDSSSEKIIDG
ncbi:MAG: PspC domain-containing protein [Parachlamydiales bacterium]|nr:PspC domain-containing protein [Parachlamydiales bacterium]